MSLRSFSGVTRRLIALGIIRLQHQRRDDRGEIGVAAALAKPVQRALDLPRARAHRRERIGDAVIRVVMHVDADMIAGDQLHHFGDDGLDLLGQRAAIGVAKHDPARAGLVGRLGAKKRVVRIRLIAVEEMLTVEQRLAAGTDHGLDRFLDAGQILLEADAERDIDMEVPSLGDQTDRIALRREHVLKAGVVGERPARPFGHGEGRELDRANIALLSKQLGVGRIGAWIARLDIIESERVELLGDQQLVLEREIDAGGLRAIAKRRVVKRESFAGHYNTPNTKCSASNTPSAITSILMAK